MDFTNFISPLSARTLQFSGDSLTADGERYDITGGIPRFVNSRNECAGFGLQWKTFQRTQLDSYTGVPISEKRLEDALGAPLSSLRGLRVLEAGSGAGRFTEILLKHGALVYSFDISEAVEANAANNLPHANLTLFQASIEQIPFASEFFDVVVCLGVLQHTRSTKTSLGELARVLKPNGTLVCDHYRYQMGMFTSMYLVYWFIIRLLPPTIQLRCTNALTEFWFPIHWKLRRSDRAQILLRRVSPINFYYGRFPLPETLQKQWSMLDTHDRNTDHYKRHLSEAGLTGLFKSLGFRSFTVRRGGTGLVARATK